jgi:tetratricopeptide (TPR) repeat protein
LAYYRSLANVELEDALKDIDKAMAEIPDEPALLDTKAWVLYRLKRYAEALILIDKALEELLGADS